MSARRRSELRWKRRCPPAVLAARQPVTLLTATRDAGISQAAVRAEILTSGNAAPDR